MPKVNLPFAGGFYKSDSLPASAQDAVNCYSVVPQAATLNEAGLRQTPGTTQLTADQGSSEVNRASHVMDGVPYFVNGNTLYRLNRSIVDELEVFTVDDLGTIAGDVEAYPRVWMASNENDELCILVPGGNGYIFTASPDTLTQITDGDFTASGNPMALLYIDGYFLFSTDEKKHIISGLNQGLVYNALDFGSAESDPDEIVAPFKYQNQLYVAGTETIEGFQNVGGADYPFQRSGLFIDKGLSAPFAGVNASNAYIFMGAGKNESPSIWIYKGGTEPARISTNPIDSILQALSPEEIAAVFAWSYAAKGAHFACFALPDTTLCFDLTTQLWHERKSQVIAGTGATETVRGRVNSAVSAYGRVLVGDSQDGRIGSYDVDVEEEYGSPLIRRFTTQPFQNNMDALFVSELELTVESGVGDATTPDPLISMQVSRDNRKWSDPLTRSLGGVGEHNKRCIWRRLGRIPRFCSFRFTFSEPVKFVALQLTAKIR